MATKRICKYYFNGQEFTEEELKSALLSGYFDSYADEKGIKLPTMKSISDKKLKTLLSKSQVPTSSGSSAMQIALNSLPNVKANTDINDFNLARSFPESVEIKNEFGDVVGVYLDGDVYLDPFYLSNSDSLVKGMAYAWLELAKGKDPALYKAFMASVNKGNPYYDAAETTYPNASPEQLKQLAASQMIMDDANKLKDPTFKEKVSNFISKIADLMRKLFGISKNVDFMNMTSKDFSEAVAKELMGAKPITDVTNSQLANIDLEAPAISIQGGLMGSGPGYLDRLVRKMSGKSTTLISPRYFKNFSQMLNYWFSSGNAINKLDETRKNQISANSKNVIGLVNELRDELKKYAKANNLTDAQAKQLIDDINAKLTGKLGMNQSTLTTEIENIVTRMRTEIDAMSQIIQQFIDPNTDLFATIDQNLGIYMNRSYAVFKDNRWNKKMFPAGMNTKIAKGDSKRELKFQQIYEQAYKYIKAAYPDLSSEEVDTFLKKLARADKGEESFELPKGKLGSAMDDFMSKKKDIAPELRAFLGEYTDPITNFYHTMENMIRYAENKKFLNQLKEMGENKIFFSEPSGEFNVLIAKAPSIKNGKHKPGDESYSPLAGMYTSRDIAEQLKQTDKSAKSKTLRKFATAFKLGKTALSPASVVRNFWSYVFVHAANGHINPADGGMTSFKLAFKELRNRPNETLVRLTELGIIDSGVYEGELRAAINEAFSGSDINMGDEEFYNSVYDKLNRFASKTGKNVIGVYKAVDDAHKIFAYFSELSSVEFMFPNMPKAKQEELTAERTKRVHVFYNKAPNIVTRLAKSPLLGTFPTWTSETIRISFEIPKLAKEDIKNGIKNKNNKQVFVGVKRLSGYTSMALIVSGLAGGVGSTIVGAIAKAFGADDEDDEEVKDAVQRVLWEGSPDWAKASTRIILDSPQPGVYRFLDVDWLNPFSVYSRAYNMYNRTGKFDTDKNPVYESLYEFGKNFIGEEAALSIILNAREGIDGKGNPLYASDASDSEKAANTISYALYEMMPGFTKTVEDLYSAARREEGFAKEADVKDFDDVLWKNTFGGDIKRVDATKQFKSKVQSKYAKNFQDQYNDISTEVYNGDKELEKLKFQYDKGTISKEEYLESIASVKSQIAEAIQNPAARFVGSQIDLNAYSVALYRIGVDPAIIQEKLDQGLRFGTMGGFPKVKFKEVLSGQIKSPFELDFNGVLDNAPQFKFKPKDGAAFFALPKSFLDANNIKSESDYIEYLRNLNNFQKQEVKKKLE